MKYSFAALVNLATLVIGIALGLMISPRFEKPVRAEGAPQTTSQGLPSASPPEATPNSSIPIQPVMTVGSIGAYQILSHHIQTDELVVNGLDLLKLEQGEINLLASLGVPSYKIAGIVSDARNTQLYRVASPTQQPQAAKPKQ